MAQTETGGDKRRRVVAKVPMITELSEYIRRAGFETDKAFAECMGLSRAVISDVGRKKILPTVPMMRAICQRLGFHPLDIWRREELDLINALKEPKKRSRRIRRYRIEVNLGRAMHDRVKRICEAQGITVQMWLIKEAFKLIAEHDKKNPPIEGEAEVKG